MRDESENPTVWAARAAEVRERLKAASKPIWLKSAEQQARGLEDKAVAAVISLTGLGDLGAIRGEADRRSNVKLATFAAFGDLYPEFPVVLAASRLNFHFDALAVDLLNNPKSTVVWSAWSDAAKRSKAAKLGLVFRWARIARSCGWCVFHNVDSPLGDPSRHAAGDKRIGFRVSLPIGDAFYAVEPLPAFLESVWGLRIDSGNI